MNKRKVRRLKKELIEKLGRSPTVSEFRAYKKRGDPAGYVSLANPHYYQPIARNRYEGDKDKKGFMDLIFSFLESIIKGVGVWFKGRRKQRVLIMQEEELKNAEGDADGNVAKVDAEQGEEQKEQKESE